MRPRALCVAVVCFSLLFPASASAAKKDSDGDGMPDRWERLHRLNPNKPDANKDPDFDGLSNINEYRVHTNPHRFDTDGDGLSDGDEIKRTRSDPNSYDTDNDGLSDGDEITGGFGTDVNLTDTDGDGVFDGDEDADGDGVANEDEDDADVCLGERLRDRDEDRVANEDENEMGTNELFFDTDEDGISDGKEDSDGDGVLNEDEDDIDIAACAAMPGMAASLKNAATAEESFATSNNGAYTDNVEDLYLEGLRVHEDVIITIPEASNTSYCVEARHEEVEGVVMHFSSNEGRPNVGTCP